MIVEDSRVFCDCDFLHIYILTGTHLYVYKVIFVRPYNCIINLSDIGFVYASIVNINTLKYDTIRGLLLTAGSYIQL